MKLPALAEVLASLHPGQEVKAELLLALAAPLGCASWAAVTNLQNTLWPEGIKRPHLGLRFQEITVPGKLY